MQTNPIGLILGVAALVAIAIVWHFRDQLPSRPVKFVDGVPVPVPTGTKWQARDRDNRINIFVIEFTYGDQRKNHDLKAAVIDNNSRRESVKGSYRDLNLKFEVKKGDSVAKFSGDISTTVPDQIVGKFTGRLGDQTFIATRIPQPQQ